MTYNLLRNSTFGHHYPSMGSRVNLGEFCEGWFFEYRPASPFTVAPLGDAADPRGLRLNLPGAINWLRIWQPIELVGVENARFGRLRLRGRNPSDGSELELEWVAILKVNSSGKRVFAKKLTKNSHIFGSQWSEIETETPLSDLASGTPYIIAVQFSRGPGAIELSSIEFSCHAASLGMRGTTLRAPASRRSKADPAPSASVKEASDTKPDSGGSPSSGQPSVSARFDPEGDIVGVSGKRLIGWGKVPKNDEVLVIVDGRIVGSVRPEGLPSEDVRGAETLLKHGFAVALPERLLDGTKHSVSLRLHSSGRRISPRGKSIEFANENVSKKAVAQADVAAVQPAQKVVTEEVTETTDAMGRRVAVVSWDMAHNPVGRAFLLADMAGTRNEVELVGPMFPMYGSRIWPPISRSGMAMHAYSAGTFRDFVNGAREIAQRVRCDVVHIGKARFSSLFIGAMIKQVNRCPMIIDVDDHELGFFPNRSQATLEELVAEIRADPSILDRPYTEIFTRYAERLIEACDGVTVSNFALQERFGGIVVRHGRNETIFDPSLYDRKGIRSQFGYNDNDRVILFLGTPRPHKGVFEIADALEAIGDDRLALCVIGSITDKRVSSRFDAYKSARISLHPDQPWERLPELVSMADVVFLLQDPSSPISDYQLPAKLTDALALGVPVYATPVPPLRDLIATGVIGAVESQEALQAKIREISKLGIDQKQVARSRDYYLTEFSYGVNAARLELAFDRARASSRQVAPEFDELFSALEEITGEQLPRFNKRWDAPTIWKKVKPDVVFLWKQNDSDIYGRRSDMMTKYLLQSGAVNRIIHFDAPISSTDLDKQAKHGVDALAHQGNLVYLNTVRRVLRQADTPTLLRRTFLFRSESAPQRYLGTDLPPRDAYEDFMRSALKEANISESPLLWVCPVIFDYAMIKSAVRPGAVVADVIDDQRRFQAREQYRQRIIQAYDEILGDADLVLANCEPVQQGFSETRSDIRVIPNGAEVFDLSRPWPAPDDIAHLPRPILGYVGNLRDRIDLELIGKVADRFRNASIVLIGSAHDRPEVLALGERPNVHLMGVKPYNDATRYIRAFDVAMVPHLRNDLSESMNPLKLYVYFALEVPIVTTDLANIGDIGPYAAIAQNHEEFLSSLKDAVSKKQKSPTKRQREQVLDSVSWTTRVSNVLRALNLGKK